MDRKTIFLKKSIYIVLAAAGLYALNTTLDILHQALRIASDSHGHDQNDWSGNYEPRPDGPYWQLARASAFPLNPANSIPDHFPTLDEYYQRIKALKRQYPDLLHLEIIGESTTMKLPIYALKVSDNAPVHENESTILISALHHAREPLGLVLSLELVETLLSQYHNREDIRELVDNLAIWLVPVVNPDGYKYMQEHGLSFPWWRKNLRDNDNDGVFDPIIDGVDLNRNYDYNWAQGGEGNPASWFYRGSHAGSEPEIEAITSLAVRENIVAGLSFHSYGEVVLYPWGNFYAAPDQRLIYEVGQQLAMHMLKLSNNAYYGLLPLNGRVGQSSVWMYGRLRAIDFIVELGDQYFPDARKTRHIVQNGVKSTLFFMRRALRATIRGQVADAHTNQPLVATIYVTGYESDFVAPRRSEPRFGRYERWLEPGRYTIHVSADGYRTQIFDDVRVFENEPTHLDVVLERLHQPLPAGNN